MLTKIREKVAIAETKVWVESDTVKHDDSLVVCVFRNFCFIYSHMTSKFFLKFLCPRYIGQLFWKIIVY